MSSVAISGNASGAGTLTVAAPNTASNFTMTLPAATDTFVGKATIDTLTNKTLTSPTITGAAVSSMASSVITSDTVKTSTSGTTVDFTSIPSWVKRITVMFGGTSTNNTSAKLIQLIYGGTTVVSTGYRSSSARINSATASEASSTAGFFINSTSMADDMYGSYVLTNLSGNIWVGTGAVTTATGGLYSSGGVTISGTLTGVRITSVTPDTFDAGSINILYE